jgi:alpha-ketoglutarate-dependent taurine dioxygenase
MLSSSQETVGVVVTPLTLHIGAEISGVDLKKPLSSAQLNAVRDAFLKWKVVFFRGQNLDHAQHVAMARQFGECTIGHAVFGHVAGYPEIYSVAKNRTANSDRSSMMVTPWSGWHTDITAAVNPPAASILRGVTIPPYGGDTFWTNLAVAYAGLSEPMRAIVDGLRGIHAFVPREMAGASSEYNEQVRRRALRSDHPIVTAHPETGERVLFVSPSFLKSIVGMTPRESQKILELLWDNRATSHLAPTDIFSSNFDRQLYRITLVGEPMVGVDGRKSVSIEGFPILSVEHEVRMRAAAE